MAREHVVRRRYRTAARPYLEDILCLRARGLSFRAIAEALAHFREADITENQVEYLCRGHEAPNPNMVRVHS